VSAITLVTLTLRNFTPDTSSYNICTALTLIFIWPWGSEVIIQLSIITATWSQLAQRHCQWWLHSVSPLCCCVWDLPSLLTVRTACVYVPNTQMMQNVITLVTRETGVAVMLKIRTPVPNSQVCTVLQNVSKGESQQVW